MAEMAEKKGMLDWYFKSNLLSRIMIALIAGVVIGIALGYGDPATTKAFVDNTKFLGDRDRQNRPKDGHGKPHAADSGDRPIIEMTNRRRKPEVLLAPLRNHGIGRKYSPGHQLTLACAKAPADAPSSASSSQP